MAKRNLAFIVFLGLSACTSIASDFLKPAILVELDNEQYTQVKQKVKQIYNIKNILIDKPIFTRSSWLVLERKSPKTMQNLYANGRVIEQPFRVQLLKKGSHCYLRKEKQDILHLVQGIDCFEQSQ